MNREHIVTNVERIVSSIIDDAGIEHANVTQAARFCELGMDDLDLYNVICSAEEVFGILLQDRTLTINSKVFDLVDVIEWTLAEKRKTPQVVQNAWYNFPSWR